MPDCPVCGETLIPTCLCNEPHSSPTPCPECSTLRALLAQVVRERNHALAIAKNILACADGIRGERDAARRDLARANDLLAAERGERGPEGWEWVLGEDRRGDRWRHGGRDLTVARGVNAGWMTWQGSTQEVVAYDYALEAMEAAAPAGAPDAR